MSSQYKENNFSTESISTSHAVAPNNISKIIKPNVGHLINKIVVERKREKKIAITLGAIVLSISLIFIFFQ